MTDLTPALPLRLPSQPTVVELIEDLLIMRWTDRQVVNDWTTVVASHHLGHSIVLCRACRRAFRLRALPMHLTGHERRGHRSVRPADLEVVAVVHGRQEAPVEITRPHRHRGRHGTALLERPTDPGQLRTWLAMRGRLDELQEG